jgi:hypothetical protein
MALCPPGAGFDEVDEGSTRSRCSVEVMTTRVRDGKRRCDRTSPDGAIARCWPTPKEHLTVRDGNYLEAKSRGLFAESKFGALDQILLAFVKHTFAICFFGIQ